MSTTTTTSDQPRTGLPGLPVEGYAFRPDGGLVVTTAKRARTLRRKGLSVSAARSIGQCPAGWAAKYALPRVREMFAPNELGTGAHSLLEHLYQLDPAERTRDALRDLAPSIVEDTWAQYAAETETTRDPDVEADWGRRILDLAIGDFDLEDPTSVTVHRTEMSERGLVLPNGVPFNGDIDRVDITPDGGYEIVDYKTGSYRQHNPRWGRDGNADQIRLYAIAVATKLGVDTPTRGRLLFTAAGVEQVVDLSPAELDVASGWFAAQWEDLHRFRAAGEFPTRPGPLCGWCPLVNACPVARVTTDKARAQAAVALTAVDLGIPVVPSPVPIGWDGDAAAWGPRIGGPVPETEPAPEEHPMTTTAPAPAPTPAPAQPRPEAPPSHELVPHEGDMVLNLNSWTAQHLFGLSALAYEHVKQHAAVADGDTITNFAQLLADLVCRTEASLTGRGSWQSGANSRVIGLLRECLAQMPAPFGGTRAAWSDWHYQTGERITWLATLALRLHTDRPPTPERFLDALASGTASRATADAASAPFTPTR